MEHVRRAKREPDCLALCYIRFKQAVDEQVAATAEAKKKEEPLPYWKKNPAPVDPNKAISDEKYRISALDGKYMYEDLNASMSNSCSLFHCQI